MKICYKCQIEKDENEFNKDKNQKDGLRSSCKECRKEDDKKYRQTHKEQAKQYRQTHKEEIRIKNRIYNQTHREKRREIDKKYYQTHKERWKEYANIHKEEINFNRKKNDLMRKYKLTLEDLKDMIQKQNNKCLICNIVFGEEWKSSPRVDHCHKTNKIRGLLCNLCNKSLGCFRDDVNILKNAIKYLKENQ
jgi:hypothetical protein